ncbi:MAG TPA: low temperature requirement protein A, partial [Microthrixaceae bacterium]|nr:low temperature requirement protein A [Microthrixaceae bacterium]
HLLLVAGIVLVALGLKTVIAHVADPLPIEVATALAGGVALYLVGHVMFRWRFARSINRERLGVAALLAVLVPFSAAVPAWAALATVAVVTWALVIYETTAWSDTRRLIRDEHGMPGQDAAVDSPSQNPADHPEV